MPEKTGHRSKVALSAGTVNIKIPVPFAAASVAGAPTGASFENEILHVDVDDDGAIAMSPHPFSGKDGVSNPYLVLSLNVKKRAYSLFLLS